LPIDDLGVLEGGQHLVQAFVRNFQDGAARLAMHRIDIMALQTANRARESYFARRQQGFGEIQEEGHAEDHDNDGYQPANSSRQRDIAEPGRRQCRNREVERVGIVGYLMIVRLLGFEDNSGHHENEHGEGCDGKEDFFISPKERTVDSKPRYHLIVAQQPQRSKSTQKPASFTSKGCEE
jgi:hypothetical protein